MLSAKGVVNENDGNQPYAHLQEMPRQLLQIPRFLLQKSMIAKQTLATQAQMAAMPMIEVLTDPQYRQYIITASVVLCVSIYIALQCIA